jgi:hypothetical protein
MITPNIPTKGLHDSSEGTAPAIPRAICSGVGRPITWVDAAIELSNQSKQSAKK